MFAVSNNGQAAVGTGEARVEAEPSSTAIRASTTALIVIDMQRDL